MTVSVVITSAFTGIASVKMAYSTDPGMAGPTLTAAQTVSANQLTKHTLPGLALGTRYYYQPATASGTLFGTIGEFVTSPASAELDMSCVLVSCMANAGSAAHYDISEPAWHKIQDLGPHDLLVHQGDFHYQGGLLHAGNTTRAHILKYGHQLAGFTRMRDVMMSTKSIIMRSDHEYCGDDGDTNATGAFGPVVRTMIDAALEHMPVPAGLWGDTRDPKMGLWYSWSPPNSNVKFVVTDFRSLERSLQAMDDGPAKTAFGAEQLGWLQDELQSVHVLKIILSDLAWTPTAAWADLTSHEKHNDKLWSYQFEMKVIADMINNLATVDGQPINVDWWGGDRHILGWLSEANNILADGTIAPFDSITASGVDRNSLMPVTGETYDEAFGFKPSSGLDWEPRQFGHIRLEDDGAGTITRTFDGWNCATDITQLYTPQTYAPVKVIGPKVKTWSYDLGVYTPPAGSIIPTITDGDDLRRHIGGDTHWNFPPGSGGGYQE